MKAELITIGDEILIGQIVDTNSVWLGQKLNEIGVDIVQITSIQDDRKHIVSALDEAFKRADIILMTGGLGPTKDDITKYTLADYFQSDFVVNDEVLKNITHIFQSRGIPVMEVNRQQANVPDNCQVLFNQNGTAPGMWFEKEGTIVVSMPGVPHEMKGIMEDHVIPKLKSDYDTPTIVHKTILTHGLGESKLAEKVEDWRKSLALYDVKLAFLPSINGVRLRLSAIGDRTLQKVIDDKAEELKEIIPGLIYGYDTDTLEEVVGRALKKKKTNTFYCRKLHRRKYCRKNHTCFRKL